MHVEASAAGIGRPNVFTKVQRREIAPYFPQGAFTSADAAEATELDTLKVDQRTVRRNAHLMRSGERLSHLLTLASGWAMRYRLIPDGRRQVLGIYLPGDTLGLETLLARSSDASVLALTTVTYTVLDRDLVRKYTDEKTWFRERMLQAIMRERHDVDDWLVCLGQLCAEERIASLFLDLYHRLRARGMAGKDTYQIELTQHQIADTVGLTPVHTNRILQRLRGRGILFLTNQLVTIGDMAALQGLAPLAQAAANV